MFASDGIALRKLVELNSVTMITYCETGKRDFRGKIENVGFSRKKTAHTFAEPIPTLRARVPRHSSLKLEVFWIRATAEPGAAKPETTLIFLTLEAKRTPHNEKGLDYQNL